MFKAATGLWQGEPISPILFALSRESLSRKLVLLGEVSFKFHPKCKNSKIIEILYTDDLLIFSKPDLNTIAKFQWVLKEFVGSSRLVPSYEKCVV